MNKETEIFDPWKLDSQGGPPLDFYREYVSNKQELDKIDKIIKVFLKDRIYTNTKIITDSCDCQFTCGHGSWVSEIVNDVEGQEIEVSDSEIIISIYEPTGTFLTGRLICSITFQPISSLTFAGFERLCEIVGFKLDKNNQQ